MTLLLLAALAAALSLTASASAGDVGGKALSMPRSAFPAGWKVAGPIYLSPGKVALGGIYTYETDATHGVKHIQYTAQVVPLASGGVATAKSMLRGMYGMPNFHGLGAEAVKSATQIVWRRDRYVFTLNGDATAAQLLAMAKAQDARLAHAVHS
jgi:hypothetical protein